MRRGVVPAALVVFAFSAAVLQGCGWLSKTFLPGRPAKPAAAKPPVARPPVPKPPAPKPAVAPPAKPPAVSAADKAFAEGMAALREGGQEAALQKFSDAWKESPGHPGVAKEFDGVLLALKKNGDAAFSQGKWEDAGKRWMATLRFLPHPAANPRNYPFTRAELQTGIEKMTASLTDKALVDYRAGRIEAAISTWKTILAYDPGNVEASKSLKTASTQLEKLKKLPPALAPAPSPSK
ncbi:MAG: hypothetical protein OHK0028_16050 [Deltaproteobacteria bacterium]